MSATFEIAGRKIGPGHPPYIIAEISANHNGSIDRALELVARAAGAGADAVKIQTYTADTMTIRHDGPGFVVDEGPWKGRHLYELYEEAHLPWEWHQRMFERAKEMGIAAFSSPFDASAVSFLEKLNAPAYKIASPEIVDIPLIQNCARTGKPLIVSTGMAGKNDIVEAVKTARDAGAKQIALLHCVSGYPSPAHESNLRMIGELASAFDVVSGLSDHSMGTAIPVAAVALGASIIEKHFTLRRSDGGLDSHFSLEPMELEALCRETRASWEAVGQITYEPQESEKVHFDYRRSLYVVEDIRAGDAFSNKNTRAIRPAFGLAPKYYDRVMKSVAAIDLPRGTPLKLEHLRSK